MKYTIIYKAHVYAKAHIQIEADNEESAREKAYSKFIYKELEWKIGEVTPYNLIETQVDRLKE